MDIKLQYIDIFQIHEFNELSQEFYLGLSQSPKSMLKLFEIDIIKKMIMFKWPIIQEHIITYLFIPFVCNLCATVFYTSYLFKHAITNSVQDEGTWLIHFVVRELMVVFSLYFIGLEML